MEPIRVIAARHELCGSDTRVRLPASVPVRAVRRLSCSACAQPFTVGTVEDRGLEKAVAAATAEPRKRRSIVLRLPALDPSSRSWRIAAVPVAAVAVIGGLLLIQDVASESQSNGAEPVAAAATTDSPASAGAAGGAGDDADKSNGNGRSAESDSAELVRGSVYSLALPPGWTQTRPRGGATFAAEAADGGAQAQLWISEAPNLDYPAFVQQSLQQLELLAGSARIVARVPAPSAEETIVTLAADAPAGQPSYEVTLRVAGPYRYYLATSVQPGASRAAVSGSELISGSFTPEGQG